MAYPQTCKEMFDLYERMTDWDVYGKIGIDLRDYIPNKTSNYAAFFYATGREKGDELFAFIKSKLNGSIPIILKRSCTEMELDEKKTGLEEDKEWERRLDNILDIPPDFEDTADWVKNKTKVYWLKYARRIGDQSYKEVHSLPDDYMSYQTFNKED